MTLRKYSLTTLCALISINALAAGDAKHFPGVFLGSTNFDGETDFTFGVEYEYKFNKQFGVGTVWERTIDGHEGDGVNLFASSLFYHPSDQWRFGLGFGEEQIRGSKPKEKDLWRISATFEHPFESFIIAPTIAIDFIDSDKAIVAGVAIILPL
ncbi:hypothetical protein [Planctobacterium marinum]|uniref:hypothetical protein n=1 Tax=Planctobacterium marinum TaxID=1631968 RepID=UPI001E5E76F5|nr:hypothetical protein [Planctobacterium marinum]MCC2607458.1 hypothetical protein [Planctobacterium marinum]